MKPRKKNCKCHFCKGDKKRSELVLYKNGAIKESICKICLVIRNKVKSKERIERNRKIVIKNYGNKCAFCNERRINVLTIDHVDNDGAEHKRKINKEGSGFYSWLIKNNFPKNPKLQVLCMNCNWGKRFKN